MSELVAYIVKQIVNNPDSVVVREERSDGIVNINLSVDPADMGIVIGKSGQTIKAIRRLLTVLAMNENLRVDLQLNEPEKSE